MTDESPSPADDAVADFDDLNDRLSSFESSGDAGSDGPTAADGPGGTPDEALADEELDQETLDAMEEAQRAMDDARARLSEVPAEVVVTNHVMGLYELAAIHLSASPPDLNQSALAIDAVACLVDGLGDRLGPEATTMRDALNNIRLAFVQIKGAAAPE